MFISVTLRWFISCHGIDHFHTRLPHLSPASDTNVRLPTTVRRVRDVLQVTNALIGHRKHRLRRRVTSLRQFWPSFAVGRKSWSVLRPAGREQAPDRVEGPHLCDWIVFHSEHENTPAAERQHGGWHGMGWGFSPQKTIQHKKSWEFAFATFLRPWQFHCSSPGSFTDGRQGKHPTRGS